MRKLFTPILAACLMAAPISATAASAPVAGQAVPADARMGADMEDGMALQGTLLWIGLAVVAAVIILVFVLDDDDDDEPVSP